VDLLVFGNVGGFQQVFINRAGAFVMQLALGDGDAVDFGFEQRAEHGLPLLFKKFTDLYRQIGI
jgi:hypothetical protein